MGLSTSQLRSAWAPPCNAGTFVTLNLNGEGRVTVDPRMREAVTRLNDILVKWNYFTRRNDTGAYNCRKITGGTGYSLHAYGIALDINWSTNPYGPNLVTDMPQGMVNEITALKTNNGKRVWEWGGSWSGNKDAMHYEADCSPADLATGIAGSQAPPTTPTDPSTSTGDPNMFIVINGVGLYALFGHVLFEFQEFDEYTQAVESSPKVPILGVGDAVPLGGRQWLADRLNEQSVRATQG
jgi:hypothetical protein